MLLQSHKVRLVRCPPPPPPPSKNLRPVHSCVEFETATQFLLPPLVFCSFFCSSETSQKKREGGGGGGGSISTQAAGLHELLCFLVECFDHLQHQRRYKTSVSVKRAAASTICKRSSQSSPSAVDAGHRIRHVWLKLPERKTCWILTLLVCWIVSIVPLYT